MNLKTLITYYKNPHFQSLLGNGVVSLFGIITLSLLYRFLSVHDLGIYIFFLAILGLVDTVRNGFLSISFIKFYAGTDRKQGDETAGSAWMVGLIITFLCILINIPTYFLSFYIENEGMGLFMKYFSIVNLVTLPSFMAGIILQGESRFDRLLQLRLVSQISFTATIVVLAILNKATLMNVVLAYIITNLTSSLFSFLRGWTMISTITQATKETALKLFHFGKYSFGTSISASLFQITDTFFINFFLGPTALAIYNLGGKLLQFIEIPLLSVASSGMPALSGHYNSGRKEEMMYLMKKMAGMLSIAIMGAAAVAFLFADPLIALIGGKQYIHSEAPNLFRIFMIYAILYPIDRFFAITLDVIHLPKINFYKIIFMLLVNVIGDYLSLSIFNSVYAITMVSVLPTIVAILITFPPLNKYHTFKFLEIYTIGYKESLSFVKGLYQSLGKRRQSNL